MTMSICMISVALLDGLWDNMSTIHSEVVQVHQALHGYQDGHALLDSSVKLSNSSRRKMLVLSDMSGPSMTKGFESYLTAYPLLEDNVYVVARTWYAPEMERPGCVWTHSVIIDMVDVGRIADLALLNAQFVRPQVGAIGRYSSPLFVRSEATVAGEDRANRARKQMVAIIAALYGEPTHPVVVAAESANDFEQIFMRIWTQQWPRLRRSFTFCSGAISFRRVGDDPLDLQAIPLHRARQVLRDASEGTIVVDEEQSIEKCDWLTEAIADLASACGGPYRKFLWDYAVDISVPRMGFEPLTKVYIATKHQSNAANNDVRGIVRLLATYFPSCSEARRLKVALFGGRERLAAGLLRRITEGEMLRYLLTLEEITAFDLGGLSLRERAKALWKSDRSVAREIMLTVLRKEVHDAGEQYVRGISEEMEPSDAVDMAKEEPGLLTVFVKLNPGLAIAPVIWDSRISKQRELVDALVSVQPIDPGILSGIVRTIVEEASDAIADDVVAGFGERIVSFVLESSPSLTRGWRRALRTSAGLLLEWLRANKNLSLTAAASAVALLDPHSKAVREFPLTEWERIVRLRDDGIARANLVEFHAFFLVLGLCNADKGSELLVSASFETVHDAAADDILPFDYWKLLEVGLPALSFWRSWDKCERLRRGLVTEFAKHDWSKQQFLRCLSNESTFRRVIESALASNEGTQFVREVKKVVLDGQLDATESQYRILASLEL